MAGANSSSRDITTEIPAQIVAWGNQAISAAQEAGIDTGTQRRLADAFTSVETTANALVQVRGQIAELSARTNLSRQDKVSQANALCEQAGNTATAALDALDTVRKDIAAALDAQLRIPRPAGVDPVTFVDRKNEVKDLITARGGQKPDTLLTALADTLAGALDSGDMLKAHIVSTLDDWAESHDVSLAAWAQRRAQVIGARKGAGAPVPGSQLYHILAEGGPNTLAGYLTYARAKVLGSIADLQQFIARGNLYWQDWR